MSEKSNVWMNKYAPQGWINVNSAPCDYSHWNINRTPLFTPETLKFNVGQGKTRLQNTEGVTTFHGSWQEGNTSYINKGNVSEDPFG